MTQAKVYVASEVSEEKFSEICKFVDSESTRNVSLQGYAIEVDRGEFTCIECESEGDYNLNQLHSKIQNIISE